MRRNPKRLITQQCCLQIDEREYSYRLVRSSRRRSLVISVDEKAQISVYAPLKYPERSLISFIRDKAGWIQDKYLEARRLQKKIEGKSFDEGHVFLFFGKKYPISIQKKDVKRCKVEFNSWCWIITVPEGTNGLERQGMIRKSMIRWFRQQAQEIIGGRVFHYARIMGVTPKRIAVRTQKRLWGNCDHSTQTIHLNWQIILSPLKVIDYVVVHELCHLTIPDHSKRFWKRVERFMPDFKEHKNWLKANANDMILPA